METEAEREAGSMQGARCGTQSHDLRIMPWAEGRHSTAEPPRCPKFGDNFEDNDIISSSCWLEGGKGEGGKSVTGFKKRG